MTEALKRQSAVFYLEENKAYYYSAVNPTILQVDFPEDIISDLELINKEKLTELIKAFVEANKIEPANITLLLSPLITFDKDFPLGLPVEIDGEMKSFLNYVPFEETYNKLIRLGKKMKVVAVNRELCDAIKNAFQDLQFIIVSIVPFSILQETIAELSNNLDLPLVLSKVDGIKQYSLLSQEMPINIISKSKNAQEKKTPRTKILIGVFCFLLIILAYVVYTNIIAPAPVPVKSKTQNTSVKGINIFQFSPLDK